MKVLILAYIRNTNNLKFLLLVWYSLRSVLLRGPLSSYCLLRDEARYEKKFAISTRGMKYSASRSFYHYQGASYRVLFRLFRSLPAHTHAFTFVDIGSGKGRAVFVAENCGFDDAIGIELDRALVTAAEVNLEYYALKRNTSTIRFLCINALDFDFPQAPAVYFLFNPFNEQILEKVLTRIMARTSAETWFIYMNPTFQEPFRRHGIPLVKVVKSFLYTEAHIYCVNARG